MIVMGIEVSPASENALESWMKSHVGENGFRASQLVEQVTKLGILNLSGVDVSMRVADRMLQKHKKARNIALRGANNWCWVKQ
ncbi:MAG: hypothetical protein PHQ60_02295 [Sideroxydans sp.]|nr:hypothetical protein [Sideroxydans sp.]MDD5056674.1 hypothetical protein [Sideroxydans sp.]